MGEIQTDKHRGFDASRGALGAPELVENGFGDDCLAAWVTGPWSACSVTSRGALFPSGTRPGALLVLLFALLVIFRREREK